MHLAGIKDPEMFRQSKIILLEMERLFQVQDDYFGCFGDPTCISRISSALARKNSIGSQLRK
ncbi:PREDICTED: farnesyl pyrophosphate synthase-like [Wasmannia auropunctata]|uniref:farnesyl pyrophosphate synthase-like n=1 Tax=Wasmannia auropunctata TaxID=64793 RepID=UPI0005EDFD28|nr:PREDICTED: farnesyl pyrophosphate synthase-like [Wasmannia auropunctata]